MNQLTLTVPNFSEHYKFEDLEEEDKFKTICELRSKENNAILAFGISIVSGRRNRKPKIGKMLAYAKAMHYLFIKVKGGVDEQSESWDN
jgi:hypothetical protein